MMYDNLTCIVYDSTVLVQRTNFKFARVNGKWVCNCLFWTRVRIVHTFKAGFTMKSQTVFPFDFRTMHCGKPLYQ